jgi:hypothetical protein
MVQSFIFNTTVSTIRYETKNGDCNPNGNDNDSMTATENNADAIADAVVQEV